MTALKYLTKLQKSEIRFEPFKSTNFIYFTKTFQAPPEIKPLKASPVKFKTIQTL